MAQVSFLACALSFLLLVVNPVGTAAEVPRVKMPTSNPEVQKAVALVVKSYNRHTGSEYYFKPQNILNSESQAVEGIKYFLTIVLAQTKCKKRKMYELQEAQLKKCKFFPEAKQQKHTCEFEIWMNEKQTSAGIQPWKRQSWRCP
nr:cystatin-like [Anolis sagrei ordinatus]